ncbi:hypothetical protein SKAU_G00013020 [Synaphobranchus kaupii]|uniref:Uncharacterized protein n=1 Tax=Synaphobranchus kaupii TaxID=118154 RepID=A0A9Q1GAE3_SYNKA|nr:hypothetical protein SKAU_G00013020 [Synaphobranchus kaupii]
MLWKLFLVIKLELAPEWNKDINLDISPSALLACLSLFKVCKDSELSPMEKLLHDMAKPKDELEGKLFELTASVRFGLTKLSSCLQIYPQL